MENTTYLSDKIQDCLNDLFSTSYKKNDDYMKSIIEISNYLISNSNKYNNILKKYDIVNKKVLNQMILSNFSEITYYRRKNAIQLDDERLNILKSVETTNLNDNYIMSLLYCDIYQFATMINDVLLYFWHPSQIYSYNIVKSMYEDDFAKNLYQIYPLAMNEHILTLNDTFTEKEFLLYTLIETMINATEKLSFANGEYPIPNLGYLQNIANKLKEHNGNNPSLPNLHKEILENFNSRTDISKGNNYDKILILEILLSINQAKHRYYIPESQDEKDILNILKSINIYSLEEISNLYDAKEEKIISSLINDWNLFPDETMLFDTKMFKFVKEQEAKNLRKRFK